MKAKKNDFYIEPLGEGRQGVIHLSLHGPWPGKPQHRFHIKVDEGLAVRRRVKGNLIEHEMPRAGQPLQGIPVGDDAFLVCRLRWMASLQRPEYRAAASLGSAAPELEPGKQGSALNTILPSSSAWDLDVVISYHKPYWPNEEQAAADNAQLGPLQNDAGMFLTVTSVLRAVDTSPPPDDLVPAEPVEDETPNLLLCGGIETRATVGDFYWFIETITSRELLERSFPSQVEPTSP